MGCVLLATINIEMLASMPAGTPLVVLLRGLSCVKSMPLGGEMAKNIDKTYIQMKMPTGKGPAVRALRAQADKESYSKECGKRLKTKKI